jgi:hypothetical protein
MRCADGAETRHLRERLRDNLDSITFPIRLLASHPFRRVQTHKALLRFLKACGAAETSRNVRLDCLVSGHNPFAWSGHLEVFLRQEHLRRILGEFMAILRFVVG